MRFRIAFTAFSMVALLAAAGCSTSSTGETGKAETVKIFDNVYGTVTDSGFALPAIPVKKIKPEFRRQVVDYSTTESEGTIIVNTRERHLYYVMSGGKAMRYGIGVGREGFAWSGEAYIAWKQEWPVWHPPKEMASRKPEVAKYVEDGMDPGLHNPLGARAMYLYNDKGQDTLFRIHGTPEWSSIGTAASSGCIRMINQDIIDLYNRVRPGRSAKVIVIQ